MAGPLSLPFAGNASTYPITQPFGPTSLGIEPTVDQRSGSGYTHFHYGTDFGCPGSTPVIAAMDGTVLYSGLDPNGAGYNGGYGNMILIQHQDSPALCTLYGHLRDIGSPIVKGFAVTRGLGIGDSGGVPGEFGAGNSNGAHLHFGVQVDRVYMNPVDYLNGQTATMTAPPQFTSKVSYGQAIYWARQAGLPENQLATAAAIAMAESGLNTTATNTNTDGSHDNGLWQINDKAHPQYTQSWLFNGANNAAAMMAISSGGSNWMPWTTYHYQSVSESGNTRLVPVTPGSPQALYYQFLGAAQAALAQTAPPPGSVVAGGQGTGAGALASGTLAPPSVPLPPPLPVQVVRVQPVRVNPADLVMHAGARAAALLSIASRYIPVSSLQVTLPTFRQAGSFSAVVPLVWLREGNNSSLVDVLIAKGSQQITIYAGYVPEPARGFAPERLTPLFTGLLDGTTFDYDGPRETLTLSGPDLSGIFSAPGATPGDLTGQQNRRADQIVSAMVLAHNPRGQKGLDVVAEKATTTAGQAYGSDLTVVRTGQNTEWDVMTTLAQNEGFALYMLGSTVYFHRLPGTDATPLDLAYGPDPSGGRAAGACTRISIKPQAHAKRDYNVAVSAYQTRSATTLTKMAGNPDSPSVIGISMPPNTPAVALQKRANSLWAFYSGTELNVTAEIAGVVPLSVGQPITLSGSRIASAFRAPRRFYPVSTDYTYETGKGLTMTITATNRPPVITSSQSTQDPTLAMS